MHLKMSSAKWRPFCLGPNVLNVPTHSILTMVCSTLKHFLPFLTHWDRDEMAAILLTTFSNSFYCMKMLYFYWNSTISCCQWFNWYWSNTGSNNRLVMNWRQNIKWTTVSVVRESQTTCVCFNWTIGENVHWNFIEIHTFWLKETSLKV